MLDIIFTILFFITDFVIYIYLARKYKTYNPFQISKFWIKEYM
jgi:hypothetical protein